MLFTCVCLLGYVCVNLLPIRKVFVPRQVTRVRHKGKKKEKRKFKYHSRFPEHLLTADGCLVFVNSPGNCGFPKLPEIRPEQTMSRAVAFMLSSLCGRRRLLQTASTCHFENPRTALCSWREKKKKNTHTHR